MGLSAGNCCNNREEEDPVVTVCKNARNLYRDLENPKTMAIDKQSCEKYFIRNPEAAYEHLMKNINFNKTGKISQNYWIAYWVYIFQAEGYHLPSVISELRKILKYTVNFRFPKAKNFRPRESRNSLIKSIIQELQMDESTAQFMTQLADPLESQAEPIDLREGQPEQEEDQEAAPDEEMEPLKIQPLKPIKRD